MEANQKKVYIPIRFPQPDGQLLIDFRQMHNTPMVTSSNIPYGEVTRHGGVFVMYRSENGVHMTSFPWQRKPCNTAHKSQEGSQSAAVVSPDLLGRTGSTLRPQNPEPPCRKSLVLRGTAALLLFSQGCDIWRSLRIASQSTTDQKGFSSFSTASWAAPAMSRPHHSSEGSTESGSTSARSGTNESSSNDSSDRRSSSDSGGGSFSSAAGDSSDSSSSSGSGRGLGGYQSEKSSAPTSVSRFGSRVSGSESSSSTSSSDDGGNTLRSRMKNLFKKQSEEVVEVEDLGELEGR